MTRNNNNREAKRLKQSEAHNRHAGMGKFWKHFSNRRGRRRNKRFRSWIVEGKVIVQ